MSDVPFKLAEAPVDPAIRGAVEGLVRVSAAGQTALVSLPMIYPTGNAVGIKIERVNDRFVVSDFAFGYREAESFGGERSFAAHVRKVVEAYGLDYGLGHQITYCATAAQLRGAIKMVAAASLETVTKVFASAPEWDEEEIGAGLYDRLIRLFGNKRVFSKDNVIGASSVSWPISARVTLNGRDILFDVVSPHHSSVFSTVSKFNDLARRDNRMVEVAVVDDKKAMGKWLPLLSQVATVIEDDAADQTLREIVEEAA